MKIISTLTELLERTIHIEGKIDRIERTLKSTDKKQEYLKSYSQYGEVHIKNPSYIDIGAKVLKQADYFYI